MIKFLSHLLLGASWLATLPAHAQALPPAQEQRLGAVPSSEDILQGSGHGSVYSLGKNGALTATLRVKNDASVSDPDWLQIEINNPGDMGTLTDWRFELSDVTVVPADPANKAEPPPVNKTASVGISHGAQSLPKGKFILSDNPAALAAATLGLPAQGVWRVRANARLVLKAWANYEVGESLFPAKTVPIEFIWRASPDPGNDAQLQWLRQYLASANLENNSALDTPDYQRAVALLKTPAMVMAINPDDLMSAIDRSKNRPRENLVRLLDEVWAPDARVVAHYRQALVNGDVEAERDLNNYAPDVWADDFVGPLVGLVEKKTRDETTSHHLAVFLLEKHYPVWAKDATIGPRLHRALEEEPASVGGVGGSSGVATLLFLSADPEQWSSQVQLLAYTHDPAVIPELRPFLDNKTLVFDGRVESSGHALSTRMCDYAHDAILHILGETGEFGVLQKGGFISINDPAATGMGNSGPHNWIWPRWDNENTALAKRLDAMPALLPALAAGGAQPVLEALIHQQSLDGPRGARQPGSASAQLLKILNDHYAQDPQVLAHYRQALLAQADPALDDLLAAPNIWADDYVELLAKYVQKPGPPPSFRGHSLAEFAAAQDHLQAGSKSLLLLDRHYDAWVGDPNFGPRLRNAYFGGEPHLEQYALANGGETTAGNGGWINAVVALAHTHDPAAVAWLRPYLDNQTVVVGTDSPWVQQAPMPWRACELAHDAILHILGRPGEFGALTRLHEPRFEVGPNDDYNPQKHDLEIQALAKYLDAAPNSASTGTFGADATAATEANVADVRGQFAALAANLHFFESKNIARNRGAIGTYPNGQISQLMMMNSIPTPDNEWPESLNQEQTQLAAKLQALSSQHAALLTLLKDHDPKIRTLALGALFDREDPKDLPAIAALINDPAATWPLFNFTASENNYTEGSLPQCVGDVAATLVRFYLVAADLEPNLSILDKDYAKPSPQSRAEIATTFTKYWAERANRSHCASWFVVKYARASGNELSVPDERQAAVAAVLAQINALPPAERAWTELYVFKSGFILTDNASDGMVVKSLKAVSPEVILQFLQHKPVTDDPDLRFADLHSSDQKSQLSWMMTFILEHATELLRPEDADAVAALPEAEAQKLKGYVDASLCQKASAALKAEQQPATVTNLSK